MTSKDYKNGKIYCIRNTIDDNIYVGSTCQPISKRMAKHRVDMKGYKKDRKLYSKMNELGVDNFYIELIEECPCDNLEQLRRREGHFIRELGTLNHAISGRTKAEWTNENTERVTENKAKYYIKNKEHLDDTNKTYRESHPDEFKEYRRKWYEHNRDRLLTSSKCGCGSSYIASYEERHKQTKQHQDYLKQLEDPTYTVVTPGGTCECGGRYTQKDKAKHMKTKLHQNYINNLQIT